MNDLLDMRQVAQAGMMSVYLDRVTDAHNVGSIARTCAFFGVRNLLLSDGCCPLNNVVAASSAGAIDAMRAFSAKVSTLEQLHSTHGVRVCVACVPRDAAARADALPLATAVAANAIEARHGTIVVLGSEGGGARAALVGAKFARRFYVPRGAQHQVDDHVVDAADDDNLDSLNVAVTAGIILHEFTWSR